MRLVFVNHYHPDAAHVGAVRLREFARVLAGRGHQVVLLTETLGGGPASPALTDKQLAGHDWTRPYVLACDPAPSSMLAALRAGTLPRPLRLLVLAGLYGCHGGVFPDWSAGVRFQLRALADVFRPQAVWATFGNTEAWLIARKLAGMARCPWVMDVKDPWDVFIPPPFRARLAKRFKDAAAVTALSAAHADNVRTQLGRSATVIYSGFDCSPARIAEPDRLLLGGSVYDGSHLAVLAQGVRQWLDHLPESKPVFTYAGGDVDRVRAALGDLPCALDLRGFIPLTELRRLQDEAAVNLYVRNPAALYQHKVLELLAAGRPVLCLQPETAECEALAREAGGTIISCQDAAQVAAGLNLAWTQRHSAPAAVPDFLARYGWDGQAEILEQVLGGVACA